MKQEDNELLLKDLCARLPYGIKAQIYNHYRDDFNDEVITINNLAELIHVNSISDIKPYLFPLSSMTEEQLEDFESCGLEGYQDYDWYNKNHFDYRGLIPMGLANDATGLNIY